MEQRSLLQVNAASGMRKSASKSYLGSIRRTTTLQVPNADLCEPLLRFNLRHDDDLQRTKIDADIDGFAENKKSVPNDAPDVVSRSPSYTKFKIPFEMICTKHYRDSVKAYEKQLVYEIRQNIDFQSNALDASYFVRCVAYTTLWPPLHSLSEYNYTRSFFQLSKKEKARLQYLMETDII